MKGTERQYYTVAEAAAVLDVSPSTVWRWIKANKLPAYRVGERSIRVKREDLARIIRPAQEEEVQVGQEYTMRTPPTPGELARRQTLVAKMRQARKARVIAPFTSADLVHQAREEAQGPYAHGE